MKRVPRQKRIPAHLRDLAARFLDAGWTEADVLFALDHHPNGPLTVLGDPMRWDVAKARLAAWLDENGRPILSRSQRSIRAAVLRRYEQIMWRRQWAELAARASKDPEGAAEWARALLAESSPAAALVMRRRSVKPGRAGDPERWRLVDELAQAAIKAGVVGESWKPPAEPVEDPVEVERRASLRRALARARWERGRK